MEREKIIDCCNKIHKSKYDLSLINKDYSSQEKIPVICPTHGIFYPRLTRFLHGSNCPQCSGKVKKSIISFTNEAKKVHNNKYDYSKFNYINSHTKSTIICPIHGEFEQTPTNHLSGNGCPVCGTLNAKNKTISSTEIFIKKANDIHNGIYSYDKCVYVNNSTPCIITCPKHGDFIQLPHNHLSGKGCPICKQSHLETIIKTTLDKSNIEYTYEQKFDWLGKQSLDFYLPEYNIAIECQGKQHFGEGGWSESFEEILKRDNIKNQLSQEHGIKLYYFFTDYYKDLPSFYNSNNQLHSVNDLINLLGINPIKSDIISLLISNNIEFLDKNDYIQVNNLRIYPIVNYDVPYNGYYNKVSIENEKNGIRTIWIKQYEWENENKRNILSSFILSACGIIKERFYARNCYIKEIENKTIKDFLEKNSMYGFRNASLSLGLFNKNNDELLMVYTFGYPFFGQGKYDIEVIRASTKINCQVIGGASKIWSYFVKNYPVIKIGNKSVNWNTCVYYVDFDHNNGHSLTHLNFNFVYYTTQGYHNIKNGKQFNRNPNKHHEIKKLKENGIIQQVETSGTKVFVYIKNSSYDK